MKLVNDIATKVPPVQATKSLLRKLISWVRYKRILPHLHPVTTNRGLVRFGPTGDGGYLVPDDFEGIEACFSPGVSSVSGFESDCAKRGMKVFMADASVDAPADQHPLFEFKKSFIGATTRDNFISLEDWVEQSAKGMHGDLMMQMDIEGFEYEALDTAPSELLERFRIIVMELHWLHIVSSDKIRVFRKLLKSHTCLHIHPNNYYTPIKVFDLEIPPLMEFTFLRKDRIARSEYRDDFPHPLDSDNSSRPTLDLPRCWYR